VTVVRASWARPARRRLIVIALVGAAYFTALAVALRLEWYPQGLPGYLYFGVVAVVGAATVDRWPLETLTIVALFTASVTLGALTPEVFGLYLRPPESLVPLAVVAFLAVSGRGPAFAPAATFGTLAVLVVLPWRDIAGSLADGRPLSRVVLLTTATDRSIVVGQLIACALVVVVALVLRRQRRATAELAAQNLELTRLRAADVERIAERERTRIARDVHDEVAHHVAALVIRAQAALRVADRQPEQLAQAVRDIVEGGQDVLARIRTTVRLLKADPLAADADAPRSLVDQVRIVVDRVRALGYAVDLTLRAGDVPEVQRTVAVGVVQEAFTNVMMHSSAQEARVSVEEHAWGWAVTVRDPGPARERFPDVPRGGSGLPSLTERVEALGGRLVAGPEGGGPGWSVQADLPRGLPILPAGGTP